MIFWRQYFQEKLRFIFADKYLFCYLRKVLKKNIFCLPYTERWLSFVHFIFYLIFGVSFKWFCYFWFVSVDRGPESITNDKTGNNTLASARVTFQSFKLWSHLVSPRTSSWLKAQPAATLIPLSFFPLNRQFFISGRLALGWDGPITGCFGV